MRTELPPAVHKYTAVKRVHVLAVKSRCDSKKLHRVKSLVSDLALSPLHLTSSVSSIREDDVPRIIKEAVRLLLVVSKCTKNTMKGSYFKACSASSLNLLC